MNIKLPPFTFSHLFGAHGRLSVRKTSNIRQNTSTPRISRKLKEISDEYSMDELITGLSNSLSQYAFNIFEHQFDESNLPCFLRDELITTMNDQFNTLKISSFGVQNWPNYNPQPHQLCSNSMVNESS
jgi:hypothetical protein